MMTDKQVYEITNDIFNYQCAICGNNAIQMHHIRLAMEHVVDTLI